MGEARLGRGILLVAGWMALAPSGCTSRQDAVDARSGAAPPAARTGIATAWVPPARCFGDSPPETFAQDARPRDLFATGKQVLCRLIESHPVPGDATVFGSSLLAKTTATSFRRKTFRSKTSKSSGCSGDVRAAVIGVVVLDG